MKLVCPGARFEFQDLMPRAHLNTDPNEPKFGTDDSPLPPRRGGPPEPGHGEGTSSQDLDTVC